jgi:alkyl hydroperoxide reductase subunit D
METTPTVMNEAVSPVHRDLKLNLQKILEGQGQLSREDAHLALLALATALGDQPLQSMARGQLQSLNFSADEIREAAESAAIMGMLNTYYKFRHMIKSAQGPEAEAKYQRAGLRMNALSKPVLGSIRFEMLAFAVSVLNGCETCITAHEKVLLEGSIDLEKIHDLARLAAIVKGAHTLALAL